MIEYSVAEDDFLAFQEHHVRTSPAMRKVNARCLPFRDEPNAGLDAPAHRFHERAPVPLPVRNDRAHRTAQQGRR